MSDETNQDSGVDGALTLDQAAGLLDSQDEQQEEQQDDEIETEQDQSEDDQESDGEDDQPEESDDEGEEIEHEGQKYKVPKALKDAFLRNADYTHKTQQLAEQRKAIESHAQNLIAEREFYSNQLTGLVQQLSSQIQNLPTDEQLLELAKTDPAAYVNAKAERDYKIAQIQQAKQAQDILQQQKAADEERTLKQTLENERNSLLTKLPEWKDEKIRARDREAITKHLLAEGYTADEINGIHDHRALLIARESMLYRQYMAGKAKQPAQPQAKQIKSLPAGNKGTSKPKVDTKLISNFKQSRSIKDALAILNKY